MDLEEDREAMTRKNEKKGRKKRTRLRVNAEKSTPFLTRLLEQYTSPGDMVLDPWAGTASLGLACCAQPFRYQRRYVGIESDSACAEAAEDRFLRLYKVLIEYFISF